MAAHNFVDITGKQFGMLKVLKFNKETGKWICECQCKNHTIVEKKAGHLNMKDRIQSCGCQNKMKQVDITKQRFGKLVAIKYIKEEQKWLCKCDCGNTVLKRSGHLRANLITSCGCASKDNQIDITNQRFGSLVAKEYLGNNIWLCQCDCKNMHKALSWNLRQGSVTSCGCMNPSSFIDIEGIKFNKLLPLHYEGKGIWKCICDCGNITYQNSYDIRYNRVVSCGCSKRTYKEEALYNLISDHCNCEILMHDRTLLGNRELDIYIPEKKIAIEFNGNYWHSSLFKDKYYHQNKTIDCAKQGVQLIHIFEYEWDNEDTRNKILNYIYKKLGNKTINRIYARETYIKEINNDTASEFLSKYHFNNSIRASINLGCYNKNNELLGVMTFGNSRFDKSNSYEIYRLCWKYDVAVIGGTEKLFKHFVDNYNPYSIITYSDLSKFTGNVYLKLGFKTNKNMITKPSYVWVSHHGLDIKSRYQAQKHKLIELGLGTNEQTEDEIMQSHKYYKVYNSGNIKLEWNNSERQE